MKIGDKLTYLRKNDNLSQAELAKKLNISRSSIGMFESNARRITNPSNINTSANSSKLIKGNSS